MVKHDYNLGKQKVKTAHKVKMKRTDVKSMDKIFHKNVLVAICIRTLANGSIPITDGKEPLQLVTLKHLKGTYLKAHTHIPKKRITQKMQECLIVRRGKVKIDLYSPDRKIFKFIYLQPGDVFVLVNGGYGIHLIKDSELIEVKNGPFIEDKMLL